MKHVVLLGDGMGDVAYDELNAQTPLQAAHTPHMDRLARQGELGLVHTIPEGFPPGSDVGNMSALGYAPEKYYTGRAPIEAASMGLNLSENDIAYRCNLVRLEEQNGQTVMHDYSAGHIETPLARQLIARVQSELGNDAIRFEPGVSYRHIMVWKGGPIVERSTPPHDILGQPIEPHLPEGSGEGVLLKLMKQSQVVLQDEKANAIWLWGCGKLPRLPSFQDAFGVSGSVISAVDLVKGLGVLARLDVPDVPGATGYLDTNYAGKVEAALDTLTQRNFVYLHVEAPDEAGHEGDLAKKIQALEDFDAKVVGPVLDALPALGAHVVLLLPDHYTPVSVRTHVAEPVPYALYRSESPCVHADRRYCEADAKATGVVVFQGHTLMKRLIA